MQLLSDVKKLFSGKCSCHSKNLRCVADCGGYHGTECQNGVTSKLLVERQNDIQENIF